ncbi:MAG: DUF4012 domain-containing protein [Patescibacteria group bacterium]
MDDIPHIKPVTSEMVPMQSPKVSNTPPPTLRKKIIIPKKVLIIGGVVFAIIALLIIIPSILIFAKAKKVYTSANGVQTAVKTQDIAQVQSSLGILGGDLKSLKGTYQLLVWTKFIPFLGGYYRDGSSVINAGIYGTEAGNITIETIEPYADLIGFKAGVESAANGEETAKDRIDFIVKTVGEIAPKLDEISTKVTLAQKEIDQINPNRYPEQWGKTKIRSKIKAGITMVDELSTGLSDARPLLRQAPYLLGIDEPRTYLLIFQNDKELRPTGGFITGYSIMTVDKGKVNSVSSNDIYNLDKLYKPTITAPDPIIKLIKGPYILSKGLRLRDMNFDPDFGVSMKMFSEAVQKAGIKDIDGIIAVDTHVLVKLLNVLGQIGVPGYGNFNTNIDPECNCPQVVHELEAFADVEGAIVWDQNDPTKIIFAPANYENRKRIIGPLMNSVLANALGQPKEKLAGLAQAAWESLTEKHVLLYLFDADAQKAVESFNIAGKIKETQSGQDYLHINDANLGGRKSNLYVSQEVVQDVNIKADGSIEKTLTISYKNSQGYDGWLNSVLPSWNRIYVPKGSTLISIDGLSDKVEPYEEYDKTVFAGAYTLRPQGVVKIIVKYKLPFKTKGEYNLLVQKQPGLDAPLYTINVKRQTEEYLLKTDHLFRFRI